MSVVREGQPELGGRRCIEDSIERPAGLGVTCFDVMSAYTAVCFSPFGIHRNPIGGYRS